MEVGECDASMSNVHRKFPNDQIRDVENFYHVLEGDKNLKAETDVRICKRLQWNVSG